MAYQILYTDDAKSNLRTLRPTQRARVLSAIDQQLRHEPTVQTRNRKPMRPNTHATWELRVDPMRVYYDVQEEPQQVVRVKIVALKEGSQVYVEGEELTFE